MTQQLPAQWERPSLRKRALAFAYRIKAISTDQRGVAAVEFGLFAILLSLAGKRRGRLDLHLPADAGGERNSSCSPSGLEGLRFAAAASYGKLFRTGDCHSKRGGKCLARYKCFADIRLTVRGILLRQFIKRVATRQQCFLQTCRLHSRGYAELATRRLY